MDAVARAATCRRPARSSPRIIFPPFDFRQHASAFNQPLTFDTSSVTHMDHMFTVRSPPCPLLLICSRALPCTLRAPRSPTAPRPAPYALLATRQGATSLSNANKLLIRCAWADTPALASAGYGSSWGPGTCLAKFTDKAALKTAVQASQR